MGAHRNPNYLSIQLGAKSNKNVVQKRSAHHIHLEKTIHDIFFSFFPECVSVVTCKVRRAFSIEASFNKTNKFIFNQIMR